MARTIEVIAPAGIPVMNLDLFDATTEHLSVRSR